MKVKIAIIGAGALGCGFLQPLLREAGHYVQMFDLQEGATPQVRWILPSSDLTFDYRGHIFPVYEKLGLDLLDAAEMIITAVPPHALLELTRIFHSLSSKRRNVLHCENCFNPAFFMRNRNLPPSRNAIANVGAFWRSSREVWVDNGILEVEGLTDIPEGPEGERVKVMDDYPRAYERKLLLHNAPHALLAYLGWKDGCTTIPEAIRARDYQPLWDVLRKTAPAQEDYLEREIARFSNAKFPDPISRVARDPARKLRCGERLSKLVAITVRTAAGPLVAEGIQAAIDFGSLHDPQVASWVHELGREMFLTHHCGLDPRLFPLLLDRKE